MKKPNYLTNRLALVLGLGIGLGAGSARAQAIIAVGGAGVIADEALTTANVPANGGVNWTASGGKGNTFSSLVSPSATVLNSGAVTLTFTHRYNFEDTWDGGAVHVRINAGTWDKVPLASFSAEGYNGTAVASVWPVSEEIFTNQSTGWGTPTLITSVANLGSLNPTDTVEVEFRGGWDGNTFPASPNWEIGTVQISDTGATLLDADFTADGVSGFTASTTGTGASPWTYLKPINRFEITGGVVPTADRYKPVSVGSTINLSGAKIEVVLLSGTLVANDTFSFFDLSGGTSLSGAIESISLPFGIWDTSNLAVNGTVKYLGAPTETIYTGPNATGSTDTWNVADNWDAGLPNGAIDMVIDTGKTAQNTSVTPATSSGKLTLNAGATLIVPSNAAAVGENAVVTSASSIEFKGGALNLSSTDAIIFPPISLVGTGKLTASANTGDSRVRTLGGAISGTGAFTIEGRNKQTWTVATANPSLSGNWNLNAIDRYEIVFNASGSAGSGNVTVSPRTADSRSGVIKLGANDVFADTATLTLNGKGAFGSTGWIYNANIRLNMNGKNDTIAHLFIDNVEQPPGIYTTAGAGAGWMTGTGTLTVNASGVSYATWQNANGAVGQAINLDHDNDGVSNGVEYFLGGNTNTTGFTALPGVTDTAGTLSITFTQAASYTGVYGTDYVVQTSATLSGAWTDETVGGNVTITGDDVKYTFPAGTKNFVRLKVTGP